MQWMKHRRRLGAFGWGALSGAAFPIAALVLMGVLRLWYPGLSSPQFNVDVSSVGSDVSRRGGTRLVVANERGLVAQSCNGECDDLRLLEDSGDNSYWVRVFDHNGACVACTRTGVYVTTGYGASIARFDVSGRNRLQVRLRDLDADGSEIMVQPDPAADVLLKGLAQDVR